MSLPEGFTHCKTLHSKDTKERNLTEVLLVCLSTVTSCSIAVNPPFAEEDHLAHCSHSTLSRCSFASPPPVVSCCPHQSRHLGTVPPFIIKWHPPAWEASVASGRVQGSWAPWLTGTPPRAIRGLHRHQSVGPLAPLLTELIVTNSYDQRQIHSQDWLFWSTLAICCPIFFGGWVRFKFYHTCCLLLCYSWLNVSLSSVQFTGHDSVTPFMNTPSSILQTANGRCVTIRRTWWLWLSSRE